MNRLFQKCAVGIFMAYALLMIIVIIVAYSRPSGSTGIDVAQMRLAQREQK